MLKSVDSPRTCWNEFCTAINIICLYTIRGAIFLPFFSVCNLGVVVFGFNLNVNFSPGTTDKAHGVAELFYISRSAHLVSIRLLIVLERKSSKPYNVRPIAPREITNPNLYLFTTFRVRYDKGWDSTENACFYFSNVINRINDIIFISRDLQWNKVYFILHISSKLHVVSEFLFFNIIKLKLFINWHRRN